MLQLVVKLPLGFKWLTGAKSKLPHDQKHKQSNCRQLIISITWLFWQLDYLFETCSFELPCLLGLPLYRKTDSSVAFISKLKLCTVSIKSYCVFCTRLLIIMQVTCFFLISCSTVRIFSLSGRCRWCLRICHSIFITRSGEDRYLLHLMITRHTSPHILTQILTQLT